MGSGGACEAGGRVRSGACEAPERLDAGAVREPVGFDDGTGAAGVLRRCRAPLRRCRVRVPIFAVAAGASGTARRCVGRDLLVRDLR
jgi:hypothetical protein